MGAQMELHADDEKAQQQPVPRAASVYSSSSTDFDSESEVASTLHNLPVLTNTRSRLDRERSRLDREDAERRYNLERQEEPGSASSPKAKLVVRFSAEDVDNPNNSPQRKAVRHLWRARFASLRSGMAGLLSSGGQPGGTKAYELERNEPGGLRVCFSPALRSLLLLTARPRTWPHIPHTHPSSFCARLSESVLCVGWDVPVAHHPVFSSGLTNHHTAFNISPTSIHVCQCHCTAVSPSLAWAPGPQPMDRLVALSPVPTLVLDPNHLVLQASRGLRMLLDVDSDETIVGRPLEEAVVSCPLIFDSDDLDQGIREAKETRRPYVSDLKGPVDGICYRLRLTAIYDDARDDDLDERLLYVVVEAQEAESREAELFARLRDCEMYRLLVNTVKDYAIYMLDPAGRIQTWNRGAEKLKGYPPHEIIGQHFSLFYSDADRAAGKPERELIDAYAEGEVEDEGWRYRKDGTRFWANVLVTSLWDGGKHVGFTKVTRDLTERRAAEARTIAEYEKASKLQSQFLANMSHEIRSPMHGILSALTLLLDTKLTPEQRDLAEIAEESGSVLMQVINDILDYSKLSSGAFTVSNTEFSLPNAVRAIVKAVSVGLSASLKINLSIDPAIPDRMLGDPLRVRQVLQNLIGNAVKFTEAGTISIHVRLDGKASVAHEIYVEVVDTGPGIPDQVVADKSLFNAFTQLDTSPTKRYKGTGLGLSISKSLVELMGGEIGYKNNAPQPGATFWFGLSLGKIDPGTFTADLPERPKERRSRSLAHLAADKRILLVEDNTINQRVMLKILASLGFTDVDVASDGRMGVDKFVAASTGPEFDFHPGGGASGTATASTTARAPLPMSPTSPVVDTTAAGISTPTIITTTTPTPPLESSLSPPSSPQTIILNTDLPPQPPGPPSPSTLSPNPLTPATSLPSTPSPLHPRPYDLVLMDINMPVLDGMSATREIRAAGYTRTPIVALTATAQKNTREAVHAAGMNDYMAKPMLRSKLIVLLERWLGGGGAAAGGEAGDGGLAQDSAETAGGAAVLIEESQALEQVVSQPGPFESKASESGEGSSGLDR